MYRKTDNCMLKLRKFPIKVFRVMSNSLSFTKTVPWKKQKNGIFTFFEHWINWKKIFYLNMYRKTDGCMLKLGNFPTRLVIWSAHQFSWLYFYPLVQQKMNVFCEKSGCLTRGNSKKKLRSTSHGKRIAASWSWEFFLPDWSIGVLIS